jgi:hypothetical protein
MASFVAPRTSSSVEADTFSNEKPRPRNAVRCAKCLDQTGPDFTVITDVGTYSIIYSELTVG